MALRFLIVFALALFPGMATAADRNTCKVMEKLMQATDKGLAEAAAGRADRLPASGIATYARHAQEFAATFSTRNPLPDDVKAALSAMAEAASAHFSIADAAAELLESGLVVQLAMPQICPEAEVPDLTRHAG